jgi:choline kinase
MPQAVSALSMPALDLAAGVLERLAHLGDDQPCQLVAVLSRSCRS